jgi:hypothetical protein
MADVECFWTEETAEAELSLRRFTFGVYVGDPPKRGCRPCPAKTPYASGDKTYHPGCDSRSVPVGRASVRRDDRGFLSLIKPDEYAGDERWPSSCTTCGGELTGEDNPQVNQDPIYRAVDGRGEWPQDRLPAGAMFDTPWRRPEVVGPDGITLTVVVPYDRDARSGMWCVDGNATNSRTPWDRTGDPRVPGSVSANPSILIGRMYHGWLRAGVLVSTGEFGK